MSRAKGITRHDFLKVSAGGLAGAVASSFPSWARDLGQVAPSWPAALKEYVEGRQEKEYSRVAAELGLGSDAMAAYRKLSGRGVANGFTVQEMVDGLGIDGMFTVEEMKRIGNDVLRLQKEYLLPEPPTRFEDRNRYALMSRWFDQLQQELAKDGHPLTPRPFLATLPSGNLNAFSFPEPSTRTPIVFYEQGLFQFLYDFGMIAGWVMPPLSREQLTNDLQLLAAIPLSHTIPPPSSQLALASLYSYAVEGSTFANGKPVPIPPHNKLLSFMLVEQMWYFAMAHELGHLALGHLKAPASKQQEFAADGLGLRLTCNLARKRFGSWAIGYLGADLLLIALNFMYRTLAMLEFGRGRGRWIDEVYPDPLARRDALQDTKATPDATVSGILAARELRSMNNALFPRLQLLVVTALSEEYNKGARNSPIWKQMMTTTFAGT